MISNTLQVFSPSFRNVHASGRSRSSALRAAGVRVRSEMVFCKLCCIVLLNSWRRFSRDCDCIGSAWEESHASYAKYGTIMARPIPLMAFGQQAEWLCVTKIWNVQFKTRRRWKGPESNQEKLT